MQSTENSFLTSNEKARNKLIDNGYEEVVYLTDYAYDEALIGVSTDNKAVYDYDLMIQQLIKDENMTEEEAIDWINYNTIRALPYMGEEAPIIINRFLE